jgi:capsid protein
MPEARFKIVALRKKPANVRYKWTWPARPHVDPAKEALAEATSLENQTLALTDALAARGKSLETHIETLKRERDLLEAAGLPVPAWLKEQTQAAPTSRQKLQKLVDDEEVAATAAEGDDDTQDAKTEKVPANG